MRGSGARLLRISGAARAHVLLCALAGAIGAILLVVSAVALARVIAGAFVEGAEPADLRGPLIVLALAFAGRAALAGATELSGRLGARRALSDLRMELADRLLRGRSRSAAAAPGGELVNAAIGGVDALETLYARALPQVALAAFVPMIVLAWLIPANPIVGIVLAATLPLTVIFMILVGRTSADHVRSRRVALDLLSGRFLEVVRGLEALRACNRGAAQGPILAAVSERQREETMAALRVAFLSTLVLELLAMLGTALAATIIGVQLVSGTLELEVGLAALLLAPELYAPIRLAAQQFHAAEDGAIAAERVFAELDAPDVVRPARPAATPDPAAAAIRIESVVKTWPGRGVATLGGVTFDLRPTETVAVIGASGAGKSTLVELLLRFADPDGGRIACDGVDLADLEPRAWRERLAWIPQRPAVFAATLAENADPAGRADAAEVARTLRAVGLGGIDPGARVGDGGRPLSAGQEQRLGLARALLGGGALLIADEPTANLDPATAAAVGSTLLAHCEGRPALIVTHDLALAARADRVIELRDGVAVELGGAALPPSPASLPDVPAGRELSSPERTAPKGAGHSLRLSLRRTLGALPDRDERRLLGRAAALAAMTVLAAVALLGISGWLISEAALAPPVLSLLVAIVVVRAFALIRSFARYGERLAAHDAALRLLARVRSTWFERLEPLVPGRLASGRGALLDGFVADVEELQDLWVRGVAPPVAALAAGLAAVAVAALILPIAGALLAAGLLAAGLAVPALTAFAGRLTARRQGPARARLSAELTEVVESAAELDAAGAAPVRLARIRAADLDLRRVARLDALAAAAAVTAMVAISGATVVAIAALGAAAVAGGTLDGVLLASLCFVALAGFEAVAPLPSAAQRVQACLDAAGRLEQTVAAAEPLPEPEPSRPLPGAGDLIVAGVRFRHGDGAPLLDGVDLRLAPGERVALIGASGVGKTTLARLLVRFADPDAGSISIGGVDLAEAARADAREAIRLAGQEARLFRTTIAANVRIGNPEASDERVEESLRATGLGAWLDTLPDGLETMVGEDGALVSGGQRQRIALARALVSDARFLVLDEPTAHLDAAAAAEFVADLNRAAGGRGVLLITHAPPTTMLLDRVLELRSGRIVPAAPAPSWARSQTRPSASIASATRTSPVMLAPRT